jgi:hypothetical protein
MRVERRREVVDRVGAELTVHIMKYRGVEMPIVVVQVAVELVCQIFAADPMSMGLM